MSIRMGYRTSPGCMAVFAPMYNTGTKKDATGAFIPEAKRFCRFHGIDENKIVYIDNKKKKSNQKKQVLDGINSFYSLDSVVFFCHGTKRSFQFGFKITKKDHKDLDDLAATIKKRAAGYTSAVCPVVVFNSCSMASDLDKQLEDDLTEFGGDGGCADEMRDAMCRAGMVNCRVTAHATVGHTNKNRWCKFFDGQGSPVGGVGGQMPVPPNNPLWKKWQKALRDEKTGFKYAFPYMSIANIHNYLLLYNPTK